MARRSRIVRFLESPKLAIVLLVYLGAFAVVATAVPVGGPSSPDWPSFAQRWATFMPLITALGLQNPFSTVWFIAPSLLLFVSTVACAWRRTQVAWTRVRFERDLDDESVRRMVDRSGQPTGEVGLDEAAEALRASGFRRQRRDGESLIASGSIYASLASPVFHWLLAALIIVVIGGRMTRAEGLMGVPVGANVPNVAASYGQVSSGPFYRWKSEPIYVSVNAFDPDFESGGIERGAVPTVALKSPLGGVYKEQMVYPNNALTHGSIMVHPSDFGVSPTLAVLGADGSVLTTTQPLVDFSESEPLGTRPARFDITDAQGQPSVGVEVAVYQRRSDGQLVKRPAPSPKVDLRATDLATGKVVASQTVEVGQSVALPGDQRLRLEGVGYYARLSVVDDWSVTPMYMLFFAGIVAVGFSLLSVPKVAVVHRGADGQTRAAVRFYRPAAMTADDVFAALRSAHAPAAGSEES